MMYDYSVTWSDIKRRAEQKLSELGIGHDDKVAMFKIEEVLDEAWHDFCREKDEEYRRDTNDSDCQLYQGKQ